MVEEVAQQPSRNHWIRWFRDARWRSLLNHRKRAQSTSSLDRISSIVAVCALAYVNRVTLLAKMLGHSETRINRQLKRKPR